MKLSKWQPGDVGYLNSGARVIVVREESDSSGVWVTFDYAQGMVERCTVNIADIHTNLAEVNVRRSHLSLPPVAVTN